MYTCLHIVYLDSLLQPLFSSFRVLLRVRMLYYLKQEVIGEHADSVLKGADIRYQTLSIVHVAKCAHKHRLSH